ncbi:hypothetical protein BgiBS90_012745, partial [Biomphalaria glabrata]
MSTRSVRSIEKSRSVLDFTHFTLNSAAPPSPQTLTYQTTAACHTKYREVF